MRSNIRTKGLGNSVFTKGTKLIDEERFRIKTQHF
jgi:hypothetical protein